MRQLRPPLGLSLAVHGGVLALAMLLAPRVARRALAPPSDARASEPVELELAAAPPPVSPAVQAPREQTEVPAPSAPSARARERPVHASANATPTDPPPAELPVAPPPSAPPATAPAVPTPAQPIVRAADLLLAAPRDAEQAAVAGVIALPSRARDPAATSSRDLVPREQGTAEQRARDASQGYIARMITDGQPASLPAGVRRYYWFLRRRMRENWQPGTAAAPSIVQGVVSSLFAPPEVARQVTRESLGPLAEGRGAAASASVAAAHPHSTGVVGPGEVSDAPMATNTLPAIARAGARRVSVEVEIEQDEQGRVRNVQVVRRSRVQGFDAAAVTAVRAALPLQRAVAMPGGRRSRWLFEVVLSRSPIFVPQRNPRDGSFMPGTAAGFEFDESGGWFEMHLPGMEHSQARIFLLSTRPLN